MVLILRTACTLAIAAALVPGVATNALAQAAPAQRPPTLPSALPPLPPPAAEPPSAPPPPVPPDTTVGASPEVRPPEAPPPPAPPVSRVEPERRWYGWQIMLTDGAALVSVSAAAHGSGWGDLALALYLVGGPVVHFAHENVAKGGASLALRVVAPLGGALLGGLAGAVLGGTDNSCGNYFCPSGAEIGVGAGIVLGVLAASIIDVAALAYDTDPESRTHSVTPRLHLAPVAAFPRDSSGHAAPTFGLAGSF
jgi:hypothetical protein